MPYMWLSKVIQFQIPGQSGIPGKYRVDKLVEYGTIIEL